MFKDERVGGLFFFIHHKLRKHHLIKQKHLNFSISKVQKYFWGYYGAVNVSM